MHRNIKSLKFFNHGHHGQRNGSLDRARVRVRVRVRVPYDMTANDDNIAQHGG